MNPWKTLGGTIRGAAHLRNGKPCQDALQIVQADGYCAACLADGHGSDQCRYSDEGAQIAVETAQDLFASIMADTPAEAFETLSANKEIWLPKQLESQWKSRIRTLHS